MTPSPAVLSLDEAKLQDTYAEIVGIGAPTSDSVILASSLLQFGQPLADIYSQDRADEMVSVDTKIQLKAYMGEWYNHIMVNDTLAWRPVLKATAFESYLHDNDATLTPLGACQATADWAALLYALGITPTTSATYMEHGTSIHEQVVSFEPVTFYATEGYARGFLEVPGAVICHLINLYGSFDRRHRVTTNFGTFQWSFPTPRVSSMRFIQADEAALRLARTPRGANQFDRWTLVPKYMLTIHGCHGCSDSTLGLPSSDSDLIERVKALRSTITKIRLWTGHDIMISSTWLHEAYRIIKRATSLESPDQSLLQDVLAKSADMCSRMQSIQSVANVQRILSDIFTIGEDYYKFKKAASAESAQFLYTLSRYPEEGIVADSIAATLRGYGQATSGSWKSQLFLVRYELKWLLLNGGSIDYPRRSVIIIEKETMPGSTLWDSTLLLQ
jgi:hypothetical protein